MTTYAGAAAVTHHYHLVFGTANDHCQFLVPLFGITPDGLDYSDEVVEWYCMWEGCDQWWPA